MIDKDVLKVEIRGLFGGYRFVTRHKNYSLCKSLIDHNKDRIKSIAKWQVGYEIHCDLREIPLCGRLYGHKWCRSWVCIRFHLLTGSASVNKLFNHFGHKGPPVMFF